jgi:hypothetical protein
MQNYLQKIKQNEKGPIKRNDVMLNALNDKPKTSPVKVPSPRKLDSNISPKNKRQDKSPDFRPPISSPTERKSRAERGLQKKQSLDPYKPPMTQYQ